MLTQFKSAMEKEELLNGLKEVIGNPDANGMYGDTGISKRTLDAYVDEVMIPLVGEYEKVGENFYSQQAAFLKSIGGQLRHEKAEFAKSYQPKPSPAPEQKPTDGNGELMNTLLQKISEIADNNKKLEERLEQERSRQEQSELRKKVEAGMKAKNANDAYVLKNVLKGATFDNAKSVDELVDEYLDKYDAELTEARGTTNAIPRNGRGGERGKTVADSYFARKAQREGWSQSKK